MKKLLLIAHFRPIDKYPPVFNLIRTLNSIYGQQFNVVVVSAYAVQSHKTLNLDSVKFAGINYSGKFELIIRFILFHFKIFKFVIFNKFRSIVYFETLSCLAPVLLLGLQQVSKVKVYSHFHEYTSPDELKSTSLFFRILTKIEDNYFRKMNWVSHTNSDRLNLFLNDKKLSKLLPLNVLPNYPPISWSIHNKFKTLTKSSPIKLVYVGALSSHTMYVEEIVNFVLSANGKFTLTFYTDNFDLKTKSNLAALNSPYISFKGSIDYDELPNVLPCYDVGLVLYKGHIPNYIYNAPNKVFEYIAAGLPTLFPLQMKSMFSYIEEISTKWFFPINFNHLDIDDLCMWYFGLRARPDISHYSCELEYSKLIDHIIADLNV